MNKEELIVKESSLVEEKLLTDDNRKSKETFRPITIKTILRAFAILILPTSISGLGSGLISKKIKLDTDEVKSDFMFVYAIKMVGWLILVLTMYGISKISEPVAQFFSNLSPVIGENHILWYLFICDTELSGLTYIISKSVGKTIRYIAKCTSELIDIVTKKAKKLFEKNKEPEIVKTIYYNDNIELKNTNNYINEDKKQLTSNIVKSEKDELISLRNDLISLNEGKAKSLVHKK